MKKPDRSSEVLRVTNLKAGYQNQLVLKGIELTVMKGEVIALTGANGAGKSTLLNTIAGEIPDATGEVFIDNIDVSNSEPYERFKAGLVLVPEGGATFPNLSVIEHMYLATRNLKPMEQKISIEKSFEKFPKIASRKNSQASSLSGGERQLLSIAQALLTNPKIMMLDEPSHGLSPSARNEMSDILLSIAQESLSVLLVEQFPRIAEDVSNNILRLSNGLLVD